MEGSETHIKPEEVKSEQISEAISGRNVGGEEDTSSLGTQDAPKKERPPKLKSEELHPGGIGKGGTEHLVIRHEKYIRDAEAPDAGSIPEDAVEKQEETMRRYLKEFFGQIPKEEWEDVLFLFVGSNTNFAEKGQRSYETASVAQKTTEKVLEEMGLPADNIINKTADLKGDGDPRPMPRMRQPRMFRESPEYYQFLKEKYGDMTLDFWIAFESDTHADIREQMGAEGPDQIADRMVKSIRAVDRYARMIHERKPGSRILAVEASHYDTISPTVKREILGLPKEAGYLVDYGAGMVIDVDPDGSARTVIKGQEYPFDMGPRETAFTEEVDQQQAA